MENKVQSCGKYSTVMQIVVIVLGVKLLSLTTVTTDFKLNPLLTLQNEFFDTLHGALPLSRYACATKASRHHNLVHLSYKRSPFDTTVDLTTRN